MSKVRRILSVLFVVGAALALAACATTADHDHDHHHDDHEHGGDGGRILAVAGDGTIAVLDAAD
ncbi:MAG: hypothetical protein MI724_07835, partial [Spirochaetales bacterium]|nr:hypothetical protein [Spirochaetales bacterium]